MMIWLVLIGSVALGGAASWAIETNGNTFKMLLAFSGAFLFGTIVTHMMPEVFSSGTTAGWWILLGFGIQLCLDFMSKGLEHGHFHSNEHRLPLLPLLGLFIHSFIEGMPLGAESDHSHAHHSDFQQGFLWSLAFHKMPIALLVASALRSAKLSNLAVISCLVLFAISTPLGALFAEQTSAVKTITIPVLGIATGLLLHVSTTILFESAANHQFNAIKLLFVALGIALSAFVL